MSVPDLSQAAQGIGQREAEALRDELKALAETRERALRDAARLEEKVNALEFAISWLVYQYGEDDGKGKRYILLPGDTAQEVDEKVAEFVMDPDQHGLHLIVTLRQGGKWHVTKEKPTEAERQTLQMFERLPVVAAPGPQTVIVKTIAGLRIAHWKPEEGGVDSAAEEDGA